MLPPLFLSSFFWNVLVAYEGLSFGPGTNLGCPIRLPDDPVLFDELSNRKCDFTYTDIIVLIDCSPYMLVKLYCLCKGEKNPKDFG